MAAKTGPKTKVSQGQRKHVQISISIPAELHDQIVVIMKRRKYLSKSEIIAELIKKGLQNDET